MSKMEDKKEKMVSMPKEQYDAIMRELFEGIIRENHDHPTMIPRKIQCRDCVHLIFGTSSCDLLYPDGIPKEVCLGKEICEEFKRK